MMISPVISRRIEFEPEIPSIPARNAIAKAPTSPDPPRRRDANGLQAMRREHPPGQPRNNP
jgi:hypothetical protein